MSAATSRVWSLDRDRDGDDDLLFEDKASGRLSWIESLGHWEFGSPLMLELFASPAMLFTQVDRDHSLELIAVTKDGQLISRDVRPNGSIGPGRALRRKPCGPLLAAGDVDGGDSEEILTVDLAASKLIILGRGAGVSWIERQEILLGGGITAIAVGDLDGDRRSEIAVARPGAGLLHVVRRTPGAGLDVENIQLRATTYAAVIADVDGDGATDLVTAHQYAFDTDAGFSFRYGAAGGALDPEVVLQTPFHGQALRMTVGDLDGDGATELVHPELGLIAHAGRDRPPITRRILPYGSSSDCAIGDFDGDGAPDVALGSLGRFGGVPETRWFAGHQVRFIPGEGDRFPLVLPRSVFEGFYVPWAVVADFDRDGADDVVVGSGDKLVTLLSRGRDHEADRRSGPLPSITPLTRVVKGDLNGDGWVDLVAYGQPLKVGTALGLGDGTFSPWVETSAPAGVSRLALADLDGDRHEDLVIDDRFPAGTRMLRVLRGLGDGTFVPWMTSSAQGAIIDLAVSRAGDGSSRVAVLQTMPSGRLETPWSALQVLSVGPGGQFEWSAIHRFEPRAHAVRPIVRADSKDSNWIVMGTTIVAPWSRWVFPGWLVRTSLDGSHTLDSLETGELMLEPPAIADFDGDGIEDVAYSANHAEFDIVRGTRHGLDDEQVRVGAPDFTFPLAGDFDGDGRMDLLAQQYAGLTWLWNDGSAPRDKRLDSTLALSRETMPSGRSLPGEEADHGLMIGIDVQGAGGRTLIVRSPRALGTLRLDAFDVRGRQVFGADIGPFLAGTRRIAMDDHSGRPPMSPGLYFLRIRGQGLDRTLRWVRL